MSFGFLFGSAMTLINAMSLAEICSAYPMNGSVFNWSKELSKNQDSRNISFHVGWLYILGTLAGLSTNLLAAASINCSII
jgi:choline transport protein